MGARGRPRLQSTPVGGKDTGKGRNAGAPVFTCQTVTDASFGTRWRMESPGNDTELLVNVGGANSRCPHGHHQRYCCTTVCQTKALGKRERSTSRSDTCLFPTLRSMLSVKTSPSTTEKEVRVATTVCRDVSHWHGVRDGGWVVVRLWLRNMSDTASRQTPLAFFFSLMGLPGL